MAFGPEDGLLFQRLGRDHELAQLLSLTLNDQIPLIVVMGESGVGKTSLLRAGLSYILKGQNVQYIYWEALPTESPERLLHAIQEQWQSSSIPEGWDEVLRMSSRDRGISHSGPKTSVKLRQPGYEHEAIHKFRDLSRGVAIRSRTAQNLVTARFTRV